MAGFVQIIEFQTKRFDEGQKFVDEYEAKTEGRRTLGRSVTGRDRDREDAHAAIVSFPSYEEAMKNNELPETDELNQQLGALAEGPPAFTDLDVVDEIVFEESGPGFVQLIKFRSSKADELKRLREEWIGASEGKRTVLRATWGREREDPESYVNIAEFASYADAMRNSELESTQEFAAKIAALTEGEPTFVNLDVLNVSET